MPKGGKRENAGRPKGSQNTDLSLARQAIAKFVDDNTERLQGWLDEIAKKDPEKAFNAVKDLLEFHVPKLARSEITGKDGGAIEFTRTEDLAALEHYKRKITESKNEKR